MSNRLRHRKSLVESATTAKRADSRDAQCWQLLSAKRLKKPFDRALDAPQDGHTLVITTLDRLGR